MVCGCCGGGFSKVNKDSFGCSTARNKWKAYCHNMAMITQAELEELVLAALRDNLMDEAALTLFCEEYAKERNRLQAAIASNRGALEKELAKARKDHASLVDAIIAGVPVDQLKDRMLALDSIRPVDARSQAFSGGQFHGMSSSMRLIL